MFRLKTLLLIAIITGVAANGSAQNKTLSFPLDQAIGTLSLFEPPRDSEDLPGMLEFSYAAKVVEPAKGEVIVPLNGYVGLEISLGVDQLDSLKSIPKDGISQLTLNGPVVTTEMIQQIEQLTSLRQLILLNCTLSEIDLALLHGHPQLQELNIRSGKDSGDSVGEIVRWAAKCPMLQYYFCSIRQDLSIEEIDMFHKHQTPLFLSVLIDEMAEEKLASLAQIPKLLALNLSISENAPPVYHRNLPDLIQLALINWSGGELNVNTLQSLMQMTSLKIIRFQSDASPTDQFLMRLPDWKQIEQISFRSRLTDSQTILLRDSLDQMESLTVIEGLSKPSVTKLRKLAERNDLRSIEIRDWDEGVDIGLLSPVLLANPYLYALELDGVAIDEGLAAAICKCTRLRYLILNTENFDGGFFDSPESLTELYSVELSVTNSGRNLSVLSRFSVLNRLSVAMATHDPENWSFIADMPALEWLEIRDGFNDDRIVNWLGQCGTIKHFKSGEDGHLTNVGVDLLSMLTQIESLTISGMIGAESIEQLAKLPNLSRLYISSSLVSDEEKSALTDRFTGLSYFAIKTSALQTVVGNDGLIRVIKDAGRAKWDALEGIKASELFGKDFTPEMESYIEGNVVLIDFWGTWCGPCLYFFPEVERLHSKCRSEGFCVLGVHSESGKEDTESYLKNHPKAWPNLIDNDGSLADRFEVIEWPSVFLVGRDGKIRVALAHRLGLDFAIEKLLAETP